MPKKLILSMVLVLAAAPACQTTETTDTTDGDGAATVAVELSEYSVTPSPSTTGAGSVQFTARNTGTIPHELMVIKTELAADQLPTADGGVSEDDPALEILGEIEEFDAGRTESASFNLTAGSYALICNVPGHYSLGMRSSFTVSG